MVDAPERIWATFEPHESGKGHPRTYATAQKTKGQEYVRSDIAERQIAELREEVERLDRELNASQMQETIGIERFQAAEAREARLSEALRNLAHEMRFLLRANPDKDGGLYRQRLDEAEATLKESCQHGCDAGGICLANISGYPESCRAALSGSGAGGWRNAETDLPPIEQVVLTRRASAYDGADIYAFGARVDSGEGWLWGEQAAYGGGICPDRDAAWNSVEADDDYPVTHWHPLPAAPTGEAK